MPTRHLAAAAAIAWRIPARAGHARPNCLVGRDPSDDGGRGLVRGARGRRRPLVVQRAHLVLPVILISIVPISIAGWGVRETAMVAAFAYAGLAQADGLIVSVLFGGGLLLLGIAGGVVWLLTAERAERRIMPERPRRNDSARARARRREVARDHFGHQFVEADPVLPAEDGARLGGVAYQIVDLGRAEIARIDPDERLAGLGVDAGLLGALPAPCDLRSTSANARSTNSRTCAFAGREHVVVGLVLLQHQPHALDIVAGVAPVALGVEIAEIELLLQAEFDARHRARDLARDEGLAADRASWLNRMPLEACRP